MKQVSRLDLLMKAINAWLELPKVSRSALATAVVQAVDDLKLATVLAKEGITFTHSDDIFNDARVNAQKIFRWLGQYEGQHAVPELLAAMPVELRIGYLNDVYGMVGVTVVVDYVGDGMSLSAYEMAATLTKENCDAQVAVIHLGINPSRHQVETAHRELRESRAVTSMSLDILEKHYPYLTESKLTSVG
ncbi:hypothetical protein CXF80_16955 [Shewanella sp. Actino-trap-3]|uniref:hypothetical protein n=1 Tax=Shewanella sp. Actino-trap-3 TaxID=2058331 RepID=UPI000C3364EE|nr:hypothetical protein [Shewanella sp. Actino-trap-3]PKG79860.1 hypothetical protein CXF80_16955 [Shewanella sp. Actino-trap-3]